MTTTEPISSRRFATWTALSVAEAFQTTGLAPEFTGLKVRIKPAARELFKKIRKPAPYSLELRSVPLAYSEFFTSTMLYADYEKACADFYVLAAFPVQHQGFLKSESHKKFFFGLRLVAIKKPEESRDGPMVEMVVPVDLVELVDTTVTPNLTPGVHYVAPRYMIAQHKRNHVDLSMMGFVNKPTAYLALALENDARIVHLLCQKKARTARKVLTELALKNLSRDTRLEEKFLSNDDYFSEDLPDERLAVDYAQLATYFTQTLN